MTLWSAALWVKAGYEVAIFQQTVQISYHFFASEFPFNEGFQLQIMHFWIKIFVQDERLWCIKFNTDVIDRCASDWKCRGRPSGHSSMRRCVQGRCVHWAPSLPPQRSRHLQCPDATCGQPPRDVRDPRLSCLLATDHRMWPPTITWPATLTWPDVSWRRRQTTRMQRTLERTTEHTALTRHCRRSPSALRRTTKTGGRIKQGWRRRSSAGRWRT